MEKLHLLNFVDPSACFCFVLSVRDLFRRGQLAKVSSYNQAVPFSLISFPQYYLVNLNASQFIQQKADTIKFRRQDKPRYASRTPN